jgi:signal transduction histidine kinase
VKNSYDADATDLTVELDPKNDRIVVTDNGQGMTFEEFEHFWMRIGSRHKEHQRISNSLKSFRRPLTGSKGVGRLAVQYLARELELSTTSERDLTKRLIARVKWEEAIKTGDLTQVRVEYRIETSNAFAVGTRIVLIGLRHPWRGGAVQGLAKEIWWLRPPFRRKPVSVKTAQDFDIEFVSPDPEFVATFQKQMDAILDIWYARLVGKNSEGHVNLSLEFKGEEPIIQDYDIPPPCNLRNGEFEIRIYKLYGTQRKGVYVGYARDYLNEFGGVHVYDSGFHLPYYGNPENDWLRINFDYSHRLTTSAFLPAKLQTEVDRGMNFLPTLSRTLGVVNVDTSSEKELKIAITRDRLQDSIAFTNLAWMIRWATDFYAIQEAIRNKESSVAEEETETLKYQTLEDVIDRHIDEIPPTTYRQLKVEIRDASKQLESRAEATADRIGLIAPLATAGIASLAYQHELRRQFTIFAGIIDKLDTLRKDSREERIKVALNELRNELLSWIQRAEMTNALFAYFGEAENLERRERFRARQVVDEVWRQVEFLARGVSFSSEGVNNELLLPKGSLVEWGAIFQNVFLNAFNAMEGSSKKIMHVASRKRGRELELLVEDTGIGVDLRDAAKLFQPFVRKMSISADRRRRGYGGTGLGLTIVRLTAQKLGAAVTFVQPDTGFRTAFALAWREQE